MYSGDKVFYAVKVTLQEAYDTLISYANKHQVTLVDKTDDYNTILYIDNFNCYEELYEKLDIIENIISQLNLECIDILTPACCNFHNDNSNVYLGIQLGENDIAYRDSVKSYESFEEYYNSYIKGVVNMRKTLDNNKLLVEEELKRLNCKYTPKIYTMTNDCESCT